MDKALAENKQADWPLVTLNLDFKSNEPEHHAAVWALLGKYERWLTTAERTATPDVPAPLRLGPMLVLTGSNDAQQISFSDKVPVGQRLRVFGATIEPVIPGADRIEKAKNYAIMPIADVIPERCVQLPALGELLVGRHRGGWRGVECRLDSGRGRTHDRPSSRVPTRSISGSASTR